MTPSARPARGGSRRRIVGLVLVNLGVFVLLVAAVEGSASALLFVLDTVHRPPLAERRHTRYDAELGWVNVPNVDIRDMYGPGVFLTTNGQGFRGSRNVPAAVPPGKRRVICSGDSMTLGYGVDDDHSWCRLLESLDPRLETVNMGQGGYGADQAYLWYKRDAAALRHQILLFAVIADDFRRMKWNTFRGYPKPRLTIQNGLLTVKNVPVPTRSSLRPMLDDARQHLDDLRAVAAAYRLTRYLRKATPAPGSATAPGEATVQVTAKLLEELKQLAAERSSTLVVVYLPTFLRRDLQDFWAETLMRQTRAAGILFIDLAERLETLPNRELRSLYLPDHVHFNAKGNEYVAKLVHEALAKSVMPTVPDQHAGRPALRRSDRQGHRHPGDGPRAPAARAPRHTAPSAASASMSASV